MNLSSAEASLAGESMVTGATIETKLASIGCRALVSIHDVMPSNLVEVQELVLLCQANGFRQPTLLVVPGLDWSPSQLDRLADWQSSGCELAGHGWTHRCDQIRGLYHRFHSLLLSRDVAEHLALTSHEIVALMNRCAEWFADRGFTLPELYVPPAWALGGVDQQQLQHQPFRLIETLRGVLVASSGQRLKLPLVGFEADTGLRRQFLSVFNGLTMQAVGPNSIIRVGIHPFDHRLKLSAQLHQVLARDWQPLSYGALLDEMSSR